MANSPSPDGVACQICQDAEVVHPMVNGRPDYSRVVTCRCAIEKQRESRRKFMLKSCELPFGAEKLTFETFKRGVGNLASVYQVAKDLAQGKGGTRWLILLGETGRGKTHLAIAVCHEWLKRGIPARYIYIPLWLDYLRNSQFQERLVEKSGGLEQMPYLKQMEFLMAVPLLVLDDLGAGKPTPWTMEKLLIVIDQRCMAGKHTVITTNKSLDELPFDDEGRIASRLVRAPGSVVLALEAPEYVLCEVVK